VGWHASWGGKNSILGLKMMFRIKIKMDRYSSMSFKMQW
jgi:hypothetical protein